MNLNLFIALRLGAKRGAGEKEPSGLSNRIAVISVAVSVAIIIISLAVLGGFKNQINSKIAGFNGHITLSAPGVEVINSEYNINGDLSYIPKIDSLEYISEVSPISYRSGLFKTDNQIEGVLFKGVDSLYNLSFFKEHLVSGEIPNYGSKYSNEILISKRLANALGFKVGDKTTSYFIGDNINVRSFIIKGIYDIQLEELDKILVIADIKHINRLNGWKNGEVSGFEIKFNSNLNPDKLLSRAEEQISQIMFNHTDESDKSVTLSTLKDTYYVLYDWLTLLDINVLIILVLMIAVAGVNMASGILIILFENTAKIGLLKSLGMKGVDISKIFLIRGAIIILKGFCIGNIIAGVLCFVQCKYRVIELDPTNYFVNFIPIDISITSLLLLNTISFVVIMLIIVIPCHFISKISPAKTLSVS